MILQALSALALKELIDAGAQAADIGERKSDGEGLVKAITQHFVDHGERLTKALAQAGERSWRALEIALAGESLWTWLDRAEDKAFRQQVRDFLAATPYHNLAGHTDEFKAKCLAELRAARKAGHLGAANFKVEALAREASDFARYTDPQHIIYAQWVAINHVAGLAEKAGFKTLAHFLRLRPASGQAGAPAALGPPLLAIAMRYFFRRAVENDSALFAGLTFSKLEGLAQSLDAGFAGLDEALAQHTDTLDQAISQLFDLQRRVDEVLALQQQLAAGQEKVSGQLDQVQQDIRQLDLRTELARVGTQQAELHKAVIEALEQHRLEKRELRPRDSLSINDENERKLVKQLVARYRALPPEKQKLPALLNALAKLEVAAGDYDGAQRDFQQAAALVRGKPEVEAEVHFNAYRTALERKGYDLALLKLRAAVQLDPARFAPFPFAKYEPSKVLGAGGFGVAFLCRHKRMDGQVVVKALVRDDLQQDVNALFAEARHLRQVTHPCIIGIQDCDFEGPADSARPYVVMDYFEGLTLEEHVKKHGPVDRRDFPGLASAIASGLHAAHEKGILHRDVKPGNVLVRRNEGASGNRPRWEVKIIDFGLAMTTTAVNTTVRQADTLRRTVVGHSIQGTLEYGAPEQMGRLPNVPVSFASDIYGFGRTCCYALFGTPNLSYPEWKEIEGPLADLLGLCVAERPEKRLSDFKKVLQCLEQIRRAPKVDVLEEVVEVEPVEVKPAKKVKLVPVTKVEEEVLDVIPVKGTARAGPVATRPGERPAAQGSRTTTDCAVLVNGHEIKACWNAWIGTLTIFYDGQQVTSGWPVFGGTYTFPVVEDGVAVFYEVSISGAVKPSYVVRRNGVVMYQG